MKTIIILGLGVMTIQGIYLGWAKTLGGELGFPIDDAWIHQVFARNLAEMGQMAFNIGVPSSGASSPLWAILLAIGYRVSVDPWAWAYLLGGLAHWASAVLIYLIATKWIGGARAHTFGLAASLFAVAEWHLAWASVSGMETCFFIALSLLLVYLDLTGSSLPLCGILGGILTVTRAEGIFLFVLVFARRARGSRLREWLGAIVAYGIIIAPFAVFDLQVGGTLLPNTFSAKAAVIENHFWAGIAFIGELALALVTGINLLLIPMALMLIRILCEREKKFWLPLAWVGGLIGMYTIFLPIGYHHMRYLMPILPWFILLGIVGISQLPRSTATLQFVVNGLAAIGVLLFGANVYAWNVQNINQQHIAIGRWVAANTSVNARVASRDIGAVGYFGRRALIDLDGLITPEIVPYLRAKQNLAPFLCAQKADYLVLFPTIQPDLVAALDAEPIYLRHLAFNTITPSPDMGAFVIRACAPGK